MLNPVQKYIDLGNSLEPGQSVEVPLNVQIRPRQQDLPMHMRSTEWILDQVNQGYEFLAHCHEMLEEFGQELRYYRGIPQDTRRIQEDIAVRKTELAEVRHGLAEYVREARRRG